MRRNRGRKNMDTKTFDNRKKADVCLTLTQEDVARQSYAHNHDYSFGSPIDFENKGNFISKEFIQEKLSTSQTTARTRIRDKNMASSQKNRNQLNNNILEFFNMGSC